MMTNLNLLIDRFSRSSRRKKTSWSKTFDRVRMSRKKIDSVTNLKQEYSLVKMGVINQDATRLGELLA